MEISGSNPVYSATNARLFYAIPGCDQPALLEITYRPRTDGTRREQVREQVALAAWLREFVEEWRLIERTTSDDDR